MAVFEILAVLLLALFLSWIFVYPLGRPGPWGGFLWFFVVLFLGTWAVAAWTEPVGPVFYGVSWVPILIGGLLIALLLAAMPTRERRYPEPGRVGGVVAAGTLGAFFWVMVGGLILVVGAAMATAA